MNKIVLKEIILEQQNSIKNKKSGIIREILPKIKKVLSLPHTIIISGIRRVGKSTLLLQLIREIGNNKIYYFNFEDERLLNFTPEDFNSFFEILVELFGENKIFFLDEIQNVTGWENFVRRMMDKGYKFIITGSNSTLLSKELGTKLTGRYLLFNLFPFSFNEFLNFKNYALEKDDLLLTEKRAIIKKYFSEYLVMGGMPEFLQYNVSDILKSLYEDIIYKDISARYEIRDLKTLRELALYYISNISGNISFNKLKNTFMMGSVNTIKSYTQFMENSFLFFTVNILSYSLKKQIIASKKIYCIDNGIVNSIAFKYSEGSGKFLENLIFVELKRRNKDIYYYKNKNKTEVDFIIKEGAVIKEVIQAAYDISLEKTKNREINSIKQSMTELDLPEGLIVTYDFEDEILFDNKRIIIKPAYKWLLEKK
jgi:predicted AAA+ superfamily ATPase